MSVRTLTLTSKYSWLYAMYPFSNDPNADPNPGWWKPEPDPVTKPFRPNHFYDEQRLLLGKTYEAGDKVRFQVPANTPASWYVLDLADFEGDEPIHCHVCDGRFTLEHVRDVIAKWAPVLAWLDLAPAIEE